MDIDEFERISIATMNSPDADHPGLTVTLKPEDCPDGQTPDVLHIMPFSSECPKELGKFV